jgi:hypothetical protein
MLTLAERILDVFPSGNYALTALLRVLEVAESENVTTAAIENRHEPRLLINPKFLEKHAESSERLLMLVMHELHHLLLGHTRLLPLSTALDNVVFDAVINSLLCRMFPNEAYTSLLTEFYSDERFPECMLRPPASWAPHIPVVPPPALNKPEFVDAAVVYCGLYSPTGTTYSELYDVLRRGMNDQQAAAVRLLGDHSGKPPPDELTLEALEEIAAAWPGADRLGRVLTDKRVQPRPGANRAALRRLLWQCADRGRHDRGARYPIPQPSPALAPWLGFDRRTTVMRAMGHEPLLQPIATSRPRRIPASDKVHVYVDVSGSVTGFTGMLYGAVLDCREYVHPTVHLFSTMIADVTLAELRDGVSRTTGGTNLDCVAQHMLDHDVRRAVMLTDGIVGNLPPWVVTCLRGVRLGVALSPNHQVAPDLQPLVRHWAILV